MREPIGTPAESIGEIVVTEQELAENQSKDQVFWEKIVEASGLNRSYIESVDVVYYGDKAFIEIGMKPIRIPWG